MITDIDPYFHTHTPSAQTPGSRGPSRLHAAVTLGVSRISAERSAREALFERTHGSLWKHGLLDGLTPPISRYHD